MTSTKTTVLHTQAMHSSSLNSTPLAVLAMVNKISEAIDNNKFSIGVFIDLSKAFDTILITEFS